MSSAQNRASRAAGRQTLLERIARLRRSRAGSDEVRDPRKANVGEPTVESLQRRIEHLESELEGLQDAVHRDSVRQNKLIEELARSVRPEALSRALGEDARRRGL
jgi:predicted RNase H-like nuclease (RuvC/YqgF family)